MTKLWIASGLAVSALGLAACNSAPRAMDDSVSVPQARQGPVPVQAGIFQAMMQVEILNDGPVTILLNSAERNKR